MASAFRMHYLTFVRTEQIRWILMLRFFTKANSIRSLWCLGAVLAPGFFTRIMLLAWLDLVNQAEYRHHRGPCKYKGDERVLFSPP